MQYFFAPESRKYFPGESKKGVDFSGFCIIITHVPADVAELADALASGASGGNFVGVQVPSSAPQKKTDTLWVSVFFCGYRENSLDLRRPSGRLFSFEIPGSARG